jgi:hypothetical protein
MNTRIDKRIVKYRVHKPEAPVAPQIPAAPEEELAHSRDGRTAKVIRMHEEIQRPEVLVGSTYKIKTPVSDHAMYVTINDIVLNEGTEYEQRRPFEVFINSKNLDHFQWIVALTRIISAVFRKGGDVAFLVDELKAVFDPRGGYWQPGGKFIPSIVAELGYVKPIRIGFDAVGDRVGDMLLGDHAGHVACTRNPAPAHDHRHDGVGATCGG